MLAPSYLSKKSQAKSEQITPACRSQVTVPNWSNTLLLGTVMTIESHTEFLSIDTPEGRHQIAWQCWQKDGMDNAPLLICVHGLTRNRHDFDTLAAALTDHYRVITTDIIGRGESDRVSQPELYGYPLYVSQMMQLLAHLREKTGESAVDWLGTSMGGLIGMMIASSPHSPITRLIMNDVGPRIPLTALQRLAEYVGKAPIFSSQKEVEDYLRIVASPFGALTDAQWQRMALYSSRQNEQGMWEMNYDPAIAMAFQGIEADVDLTSIWDAVACPVLVIRGQESDLLTAEDAKTMTSKKSVQLVEIPDVGHAPALMSDDQIGMVRDFLVM